MKTTHQNSHSTASTDIGLSGKSQEVVVKLLNALLSDEYVLYTKTRNYHWNVTGSDFHALHKFFEAQYEELNVIIDDVAERARAVGGRAMGTLAEFLQRTRLDEAAGQYPDALTMVRKLQEDHETIIVQLRGDIEVCGKLGDAGTNDFLTGLMEQHEKMAWMLRAHLE